MTHSPAPWIAVLGLYHANNFGIYSQTEYHPVCEVHSSRPEDDTLLITAAPEMHKALEAVLIARDSDDPNSDPSGLLDRMEAIGEDEHWISGEDLHEWALGLSRAALALANGKER